MDKLIGITTARRGHGIWRISFCAVWLCAASAALAQDQWANLPDPTRPSNPWGIEKPAIAKSNQSSHLTLDSTIISNERRLAIINGQTLGIGSLINGARIINITPYKVVLEENGHVVTLVLVSDKVIKPLDHEVARR
jgi:MSHA biogenesis protein MshK